MRQAYTEKDRTLIFILLSLVLGFFAVGYWSGFQKILIRWSAGDNSYCFLIVPLFLYLLFDKKDFFKRWEFSWNVWGLLPIVLSVLLIIIGELGSVETLLYIGIWGCLAGLAVILYGRQVRYLFFPLLILFFIVPLPPFINRMLTFQLKLAASKLSALMLRASGVSLVLDGNIIDLGVSQLQVVDACSGLRYLMPLLLMALLVGYFFNKRLWQRGILILVVVPLSLFVNSIRIWITGLLTVQGHEELAQSFFHDFSGWLVFMVAGGVLFGVSLILKKIKVRIKDQGLRIKDYNQPNYPNHPNEQNVPNRPRARPVILTIVLCLLFGGSGWALKKIPSTRNLPQRSSFVSFPMQIDQWVGERHYISKEILDQLWSDDYLSVTYSRPHSDNHVNVLIPFYEYQGTRHTAHAPQSCMLGGGWALFNSEERWINVSSQEKIQIMTMIWKKGHTKYLGSYFFFQRGRVITSPWTNKFYLMWDAIAKQRTDGALVRVEVTVSPGQPIDEAYGVLEEFISELWPILPEYVPE